MGQAAPRIAAIAGLAVLLTVSGSSAGPDKVAFPAAYKDHTLYATVDRYDTKQYRELYGTPDAVKAMKDGRPLPSGSVLTLVQYKARLDGQGDPIKDANGRFVKGDLIAYTVMEKRTGWGTEYPPELRNGEWEYAAFAGDGKLNEKANYKACFQCHKPHEKQDFVISLAKLAPPSTAPVPRGDVTIAGFVFGPGKVSVPAGKPVTWVNTDDSPHQITFPATQARSTILTKGQSHAQSFAAPGQYDYICGLHPSMKGSIQVTK
jgi:plastocyanin